MVCNRCGNMVPDGSQFCIKCGAKLRRGNNQNLNTAKHKNIGKNVFIPLAISLIIVLVVIAVIAGLNSNKPSTAWLEENLPTEVLNYKVDDVLYTSTVDSLKIDRRSTKNGIDTCYCIVELKSEILNRTVYINMYSKKYDQGWHLESWSEYQEAKIAKINKGFSEDDAKKYISEECGYLNFSDFTDSSDLSRTKQQISYTWNINDIHKYLDVNGKIKFTATLNLSDKNIHKDNDTLYRYSWGEEIDDSEVKKTWNIDGKYELASDYADVSYINVSLTTNSDSVEWQKDYKVYQWWSGDEKKSVTGSSGYESRTDSYPNDAVLQVVVDNEVAMTGTDYLVFTSDSVVLNSSVLTGWTDEYEMKKSN